MPIAASTTHLGDRPEVVQLIGTVKVMLDQYRSGEIDRLILVHNVFVNTMSQKGVTSQLLPVEATDTAACRSVGTISTSRALRNCSTAF